MRSLTTTKFTPTNQSEFHKVKRVETLYLPLILSEKMRKQLFGLIMGLNIVLSLAIFLVFDILFYQNVYSGVFDSLNGKDISGIITGALSFILSTLVIILVISNVAVFLMHSKLKTSPGRINLIKNDYLLLYEYYSYFLLLSFIPGTIIYILIIEYITYGKFQSILEINIADYGQNINSKLFFDRLQQEYKCCGVTDLYEDWANHSLWLFDNKCIVDLLDNCLLIPFSCCDITSNFSCNAIGPKRAKNDRNGLYDEGCASRLQDEFNSPLYHVVLLLGILWGGNFILLIAFKYLRTSIHNATLCNHPRLTSYGWLIGNHIEEIEQKDLLKLGKPMLFFEVNLRFSSSSASNQFASNAASGGRSTLTRRLLQQISGALKQKKLLNINAKKVAMNSRYITFNDGVISTVSGQNKYELFVDEKESKVVVSTIKKDKTIKKRKKKNLK